MAHTLQAVAVVVVLAGLLLFTAPETAVVGGVLVAAGAYAMMLPRLVRPEVPATR